MAHDGHVVEQHEPTWTPTWRDGDWASRLWVHGLVGSRNRIGAYLTHEGEAPLKANPPFILLVIPLFLSVGLCSLYFFPCRTRGGVGCIGCDRFNQRVSIAWTRVHLITMNAHDDFYIVDLIN